jgi:hypothetical protein
MDFEELIYRQIESDTLDYKAHQSWSEMGAAGRGKFIRHLAAFANTHGGVLVVGVGEDASGCPCDYTGLTDAESRSFDPTAVGTYVNACVEPPIDFTLERPLVRGKRYAVFIVRPFTNLPHVCTRSAENELQSGVFYIRTPDASSRPAHRALEMHRLIQRALRNQRELLAKMIRGILYENRGADGSGDDAAVATESQADDIFASSLAYFRRRRTPRPGDPGVLAQYYVSLDCDTDLPAERIRDAAAAASDDGFITAAEVRRANPGNMALRYLDREDPRMFQLFRRAWIYQVEYLPADGAELSVPVLAGKLVAFCRFIGAFYRELGLDKAMLELNLEISGLNGVVIRYGDREYPSLQPQIKCRIVRSAADIGGDVAGYAARLLREFGEGFGLPDAVISEAGRHLAPHFMERA